MFNSWSKQMYNLWTAFFYYRRRQFPEITSRKAVAIFKGKGKTDSVM